MFRSVTLMKEIANKSAKIEIHDRHGIHKIEARKYVQNCMIKLNTMNTMTNIRRTNMRFLVHNVKNFEISSHHPQEFIRVQFVYCWMLSYMTL